MIYTLERLDSSCRFVDIAGSGHRQSTSSPPSAESAGGCSQHLFQVVSAGFKAFSPKAHGIDFGVGGGG